ncbi:M15 family metallopeptidase [Actinotalea sp. BY-33]|uniref:M15 family metallopeptidase n=1 Tax=Actinotalea soli TaxID=2819234 RepID=A0A939RUC8_9CELL|nr:M15 family metallopeptidase [Actinotalea soli]MBO1750503.1 M15 family metallopeptidase [Actinotalea soli]
MAAARLSAQGSAYLRLERAEAVALAEAAMASAAVLTAARSTTTAHPRDVGATAQDPVSDRLQAAVDVLSRVAPRSMALLDDEDAPRPDDSTASVRAAAAVVFALSVEEDLAARPTATADLQATEAALSELEAGLAAASTAAAAVTSTVLEPTVFAPVPPGPTASSGDLWPNGEIPLELLCSPEVAPDALLRCDAAAALDLLNTAYRAELGRDLDVVSSYRSVEQQVVVKAARGWLAATPGTSNHGRGIAVDLGGFGSVGDFSSPSFRWMEAHAHEFGWFHPDCMKAGGSGPAEPWHWEYGG